MPHTFAPANLDELSRLLRRAHESKERIGAPDLRAFHRVIEHVPEDMTITVEAGMTLGELQQHLRPQGQWLPVDPPGAESLSLESLFAANASGPRRHGFGTPRDYVIGMRVALADGQVIKTGGKVVKNVAGYDLARLFLGSRGSLGVIVELSLKLRPLPEAESFYQSDFPTPAAAMNFVNRVLDSPFHPVVLDLHRPGAGADSCAVALGFAGAGEDVELDSERARQMGCAAIRGLEYENTFWTAAAGGPPVHRRSVLPSRLGEAIAEIGGAPFVARAGNGVLYHRGGPPPMAVASRHDLADRVKAAFDPHHVFPDVPV